jgi:hypothetical protein
MNLREISSFREHAGGPVLGGIVDAHVRPRVLRWGCPPLPPGLRSTASPGALFVSDPEIDTTLEEFFRACRRGTEQDTKGWRKVTPL